MKQLELFGRPIEVILKDIKTPKRTEISSSFSFKKAFLRDFYIINPQLKISSPTFVYGMKEEVIHKLYSYIRKKFHIYDEDILPKKPW